MSRRWIGPLVIAVMFAVTIAAWSSLPETVPTHWNAAGEVDGWGSRNSLFIMPAVGAGMWGMFILLWAIGPRRANLEKSSETWWLVANFAIIMLAALHLALLGAARGWPMDVTRVIFVITGLSLAVLGNYMPRLKPNWWMGIRTPWTLENDEVWRATHRMGGKWMMFGGLAAAAVALLPAPTSTYLFTAIVLVSALVPAAYSYVLWRRLGGDAGPGHA